MSRRPIALSADLARLQNEGYDIDVRGGYLLARDVPYVRSDRSIGRGVLISRLELSGDVTVKPSDHSKTGAEVIAKFLPVRVTFDERADDHLVTVTRN